MNKSQQIRAGLAAFAAKYGPLQTILAKVASVDAVGLTCECDYDGTTLFDVRLRCVINGKESSTFFPKVGSYVLIARIENSEEDWMVIACDELDRHRIVIGALEFEMDGATFSLKKGGESLKKLFDDLITAMVNERHMTNTGVTISLTPASVTALNNLKQRLAAFLK